MKRILIGFGIAIGGALALSACDGGSGGVAATTPVTTTPPTTTAFQSRFGTAFAADFNASTTAEPVKPAAADVPALSLTTEPLDN